MRILQCYYKGEKISTIYNIILLDKVDIVIGKRFLRSVDRDEIMVRVSDAEKIEQELEDLREKIKELIDL